jgi:hypothetical protein
MAFTLSGSPADVFRSDEVDRDLAAGANQRLTVRRRGQGPDMTTGGGWVKRLWQYYDAWDTHGWTSYDHRICEEIEMAVEDDAPPMKRRRLEPLLLDSLGIEELRLYIDELAAPVIDEQVVVTLRQRWPAPAGRSRLPPGWRCRS